MQLDYFITSSNLNIVKLETHLPISHINQLECYDSFEPASQVITERTMEDNGLAYDIYKTYEPKQFCGMEMNLEYANLREASDHLPLILEFSI